jgi:lipid II:glycine glycyltransferase (peptidoglycan interpeptide bridge formation enzyme)
MLLEHEDASFFHTSAWARVLHESYNYKPLYFTVIDKGKLVSLIPVMEVKSFLTGRRGVSLPFTDHCPPICSDPTKLEEILNRIIEYGKTAGWKYIDVRGDSAYFNAKPAAESFYVHSLDLSKKKEKLFLQFRDSTKRNIKRSRKEEIEVRIENSRPALEAYFQLHCTTRKHHGLPPQPKYFFQKIFERIIARDKGFVVLAYRQGKAIAGAVFFHFKDQAIYKYGASDRNYLHLRPNNLVMWQAIEWFAENGFKSFNLGRTEPENDGLLQFKRGWGAKETNLSYYKYDLKKDSFISDTSGVKSSYNLFKMLPISMLRIAGNFLYRHVG